MLLKMYRVSHTLYKWNVPLLPRMIMILNYLLFNSSIPYQASIGKGTKFGHGGIAVVINKKVAIGKNCVIGSCVTIGGKSKQEEVPVIGDFVYIASGARVLGNVKIGDNVIIGANSVVVKDVPSNCMVGGIPAKVIRTNIQFKDYV
jgi:serine O-acetyltransferase